jgi:hypothetical protein
MLSHWKGREVQLTDKEEALWSKLACVEKMQDAV